MILKWKKFNEKKDITDTKETVDDILVRLTDNFDIVGDQTNFVIPVKGQISIYDRYNDDGSIFLTRVTTSIKDMGVKSCLSNNISVLSSLPFYDDLLYVENRLNRLSSNGDFIFTIYTDNISGNVGNALVNILINYKLKGRGYSNDQVYLYDNMLTDAGFCVGEHSILLELDNIILSCRKPKPIKLNKFGRFDNPENEFFSNAHNIRIFDKNYKDIAVFDIDERGFNRIYAKECTDKKLRYWILSEHQKMKDSKPIYKNESGNLYAHYFFHWLKNSDQNKVIIPKYIGKDKYPL